MISRTREKNLAKTNMTAGVQIFGPRHFFTQYIMISAPIPTINNKDNM
jgi:hypothetical protein